MWKRLKPLIKPRKVYAMSKFTGVVPKGSYPSIDSDEDDEIFDLRKNFGKVAQEQAVKDSGIFALTDAATITLNLKYSKHFSVTLAGNRTFANPTNLRPQRGRVIIKQDATGSRVASWGDKFRFAGGKAVNGVLSTAANAIDILIYEIIGDGLVYARLEKDVKV